MTPKKRKTADQRNNLIPGNLHVYMYRSDIFFIILLVVFPLHIIRNLEMMQPIPAEVNLECAYDLLVIVNIGLLRFQWEF